MAGETVRAVLGHVWSALQPLNCPAALVGGIALALWNHPRATRDVDLLIGVEGIAVDSLIEQLRSQGFRTKNSPLVLSFGPCKFVQFLCTPPGEFYDVQFDLMLAETDLQKSALARRVQHGLPGIASPVDVIRCDDLILFKLATGRMIDRADAAMLLRENRDALDLEYLLHWVIKLGLTEEFSAIWRQAFPDESAPTGLGS